MTTTQQREDQSNFVAILRMLRNRWKIVLACAIILPAAALAFSLSQQKQYSTSASLLFRDPQFDQKLFGSTVFAPTVDPAREAATNVRLVSLKVVADRTAKQLHVGLGGQEVLNHITVASEGQSDVVSITATDPSPPFAAKLANAFAQEYIGFRRDADRSKIQAAQQLVQRQISQIPSSQRTGAQYRELRGNAEQLQILASLQTGNAELVQPADVPTTASHPQPMRNTFLGLILGVLLGIALAVALERFDRRLKDPREISDAFGRPVLGAVPESRAIAASSGGPAYARRPVNASRNTSPSE